MADREPRRLGALRDLLGRPVDALLGSERRARLAREAADRLLYSNERLTAGRCTYGEPRVATFPGDTAHVRIGAFCSLGPDVILMDGGDHRVDWVSTFPSVPLLASPAPTKTDTRAVAATLRSAATCGSVAAHACAPACASATAR